MNYKDLRKLFDTKSHLGNAQILAVLAKQFVLGVQSVRLEIFTHAVVKFDARGISEILTRVTFLKLVCIVWVLGSSGQVLKI